MVLFLISGSLSVSLILSGLSCGCDVVVVVWLRDLYLLILDSTLILYFDFSQINNSEFYFSCG